MSLVRVIENDAHFQTEMASAGTKLVVIHFTAAWCQQRIDPFFEQLTAKYPRAVFLKVDVDCCPETADAHRVSVFPTFNFYRNRTKIDYSLQGVDPSTLENKVQQYYDTIEAGAVAGHVQFRSNS